MAIKYTCTGAKKKAGIIRVAYTLAERNVYFYPRPLQTPGDGENKIVKTLAKGAVFKVYEGPTGGGMWCSPKDGSFSKIAGAFYPRCRWFRVVVEKGGGAAGFRGIGWVCSGTLAKKGAKAVTYVKFGTKKKGDTPKKKGPVGPAAGLDLGLPLDEAPDDEIPVAPFIAVGVVAVGLLLFFVMRRGGR